MIPLILRHEIEGVIRHERMFHPTTPEDVLCREMLLRSYKRSMAWTPIHWWTFQRGIR